MNPLLMAICRIGSALLVGVATATAAVRPVPAISTGLSHALTMAQPGDTLLLAEGNHRAAGLHLLDGLTLIGEGTGARFEGRGGQSFFIIRNATRGVLLQNLVLLGARSRESGGAIRACRSRLVLESVTIEECRSKRSGGALFAEDCHVELMDCLFLDNRAEEGGAIAMVESDSTSLKGRLLADNVLFAGNRARKGGAMASVVPVRVTHGTFVGNAVQGRDAEGAVIQTGSSLELVMCNLDGNTVDGTGVGPVEVSTNDAVTITYSNVYGNLSDDFAGNWVGDLDGLDTGIGNKEVDSQFVDRANQDYRLKWKSPLMDAGASGEPDFDLTTQDIGWQKPYPVLYALTTTNSVLPAGRYEINVNTYLNAADLVVEHDVVIRVAASKKVTLDDSSNGGSITIGDDDGARTALVGAVTMPNSPSDLAGDIIFGHTGASQPCDLQFEGTLFNVGPNGLWFNSSTVSLIGKDGGGTPNCEFRSYGGSTITFANCTGAFRQHNFYTDAEGALPSVRGVYLHYSDMDVEDVKFDRGNEEPLSPSGYGVLAFGAPTFTSGTYSYTQIADCFFTGSDVYGAQNYVPAVFLMAEAGLTADTLYECRDRGAILAYESTLHMAGTSHGMNKLELADIDGLNNSIIELQGSSTLLHLKCGYNCFVNPQVDDEESEGFIISDQTTAPAVVDWSRNFWSTSFTAAGWTSFDLCDDLTGCDLPSWAEPYPTLNTCPDESLGPCDENLTISEEYAASLLAQEAFNYSSAWVLWKSIVLDSPESDEASLAAGRMKSVALNTTWGAENSTDLVADLIQAADSAWDTSASLGVLESTHAWVVEALHGDRELALAQLDTLLATWTDPADQSVVSLGIAEVESFPTTGGMSAAGGAGMASFARAEKLQAFQQHLLNGFVLPAGNQTEATPVHPAGFTLSPALPNPFNPTTQLTLDVAVGGAYHVDLFNLQGQLVRRLLDESLSAGVQNLTVDGSQLASGVYFVNAVGPKGSQNQKLLLVK